MIMPSVFQFLWEPGLAACLKSFYDPDPGIKQVEQ
jgi:hypothetical protein